MSVLSSSSSLQLPVPSVWTQTGQDLGSNLGLQDILLVSTLLDLFHCEGIEGIHQERILAGL